MSRRNTVEVIITAKDKASKQLKGIDQSVGKLGTALSGLALVGAAKAAFELAKLGAQSLRTKTAFEAISGGAENASRNLRAMTEATRGALSEQKAMAAANQLMQMGLANNAEELGKVAEMATRLGTAMGRDASESIESFALLLANQSIPRLDTFGISAGKTRARILELMEANEGLSRETAFMTATMELGGEAMERLGPQADDAANSFEVLDANIENLKTSIGEKLVPVLNEALTALNLLTTWNEKVGLALSDHRAEVQDTAASYEEYAREMLRANAMASGLTQAEWDLSKGFFEAATVAQLLDGVLGELIETGGAYTIGQFYAERATDAMAASARNLAMTGMHEMEMATRDMVTQLLELGLTTDATTFTLADMVPAAARVTGTLGDTAAAVATTGIMMRDLTNNNLIMLDVMNKIPAELRVQLNAAGFKEATADARGLISALDDLNNKVKTSLRDAEDFGSRAPGAGARTERSFGNKQSGGVGMGLTRVGEGGPELVNLPPRSRVFSNEASQMMNSNNRTSNLTIHTSAPHEPIVDDFRMMEAFMGA